MTIAKALQAANLEPLDAQVLLAFVLGCTKEKLITNSEYTLSKQEHETWQEVVKRRLSNEPVAYITNTKEFYGRDFYVTSDVLIPRPATEGLVDIAVSFLQDGQTQLVSTDTDIVAGSIQFRELGKVQTVVDIGTGSGCIAISVALELPDIQLIGSDISPDALRVAKRNAKALAANIEWKHSDGPQLLVDIQEPFLVVSNPPYIPTGEQLQASVYNYEPHTALFAGEDGADLLRIIFDAAKENPMCAGICFECKTTQWKELEKLA